MKQYLELVNRVLSEGVRKDDRTGTGTLSVFGHQMRFDLSEGFPLLTTKKLHVKSIIHELLWFLMGSTNTWYLKQNGVKIWDEWAAEDGELGPVYGYQWKYWPAYREDAYRISCECVDQIAAAVDLLCEDPDSRRNLVSAWNVADLNKMALVPCHCLFQLNVTGGKLSCQMYQRSCDIGLGVPFNIASYALLTMMFAQVANLKLGEFIWVGGDTHIYLNHIDALEEQLNRIPRPLPTMKIRQRGQGMNDFLFSDFQLSGYDPYPHIKMDISV